jgi:hypothetical protein
MTTTGDADRRFALAARYARTTDIIHTLGNAFEEGITVGWRRAFVVRILATTAKGLSKAWASASAVRRVATGWHYLQNANFEARITALTRIILSWTQSSWIYRWLTTEPEPEVMVIDLRETLAFGPIIQAIDRTLRWLVPAAASAVVVHNTERVGIAVRRRPVRLASLGLAGMVTAGVALLILTGGLDETTIAIALVGGALAIAGLPVRATLEDVRQHPVTRAIVAALEPPEPPDRK